MKRKERMKRVIAGMTGFAIGLFYTCGGGVVKASETISGDAIQVNEQVDNEKIDNDTSNSEVILLEENEPIDDETNLTKEDKAPVKKRNSKKQKTYIVKVKNKETLKEVEQKYNQSEDINDNSEDNLEKKKLVSVELTGDQADKLEQNNNIEYLEEDYIVKGCKNEKSDKKRKKEKHQKKEKRNKKNDSKHEWNVRMIKAEEKATKKDGKHVKVAVIDSGIDWGNDINLVYQTSLVPGEEEMTQVFMDGNGHGSSVASLIAAIDDEEGITGINPNVDIYSYRVLAEENSAPISRVVEAIYMAIDQEVNIINMSFGVSEYSEALEQAVKDAKKAGILIIAAAGNTGEDGVQYPAAFDEVMAVGAVNKYGNVEDYSAKGEEVEVVAPGELVRTTGFIGSEEVTSGTSLAAPQVTAVASLIWQEDLSVSADFVRGLLDDSANLYGDSDKYGYGLVDAEYALSHYKEYKKNYKKENKKQNSELIKNNESEIVTFDDTGCVKGCWSKNVHANMIDSDYFCVRAGARFPDETGNNEFYYNNKKYIYDMGEDLTKKGGEDTRKFAGMTKSPWWHGYFENNNYIKASIYATRIAEKIDQNGKVSGVDNSIQFENADKMEDSIKELKNNNNSGWTYALKYMKSNTYNNTKADAQKLTKGFRRAFIWGMAIHTATDVYAHSTDYRGERIKHEYIHSSSVKDADNTEYKHNRYLDAIKVAKKIMARYKEGNGHTLVTSDLQTPNCRTVGYRLINYQEYIGEVDSNYSTYSYTYSTK